MKHIATSCIKVALLLFLCIGIFIPSHAQLALEFDINQDPDGSSPDDFLVVDDRLYFAATDGLHGEELWVYDQSSGQAEMIMDIYPFEIGSDPVELVLLDSRIYFSARDPQDSRSLWVHNTQTGVTERVVDADNYLRRSDPIFITAYAGNLYFQAERSSAQGREMWEYSPTTNTARLIADINPGSGDAYPSGFTVFQDKLFFVATTPGEGSELWSYDDATGQITPEDEGVDGPEGIGGGIMAALGNTLFFTGYTSTTGEELWKYDPVSGLVSMVMDIYPGFVGSSPNQYTLFNDKLYFQARTQGRNELWSVDGNEQIEMVTDINPSGNATPGGMQEYLGRLVFSADDGIHGREVYSYNPLNGLTVMAFELGEGPEGCQPYGFTPFGGDLIFSAFTPDVDQEIWTYQLASGPSLLYDVNTATVGSSPSSYTPYAGKLYFRATDYLYGDETWVYDPNSGTTTLLRDLISRH
jgi:ELWxxDGT repeat protein